jgi:hypothetical protein
MKIRILNDAHGATWAGIILDIILFVMGMGLAVFFLKYSGVYIYPVHDATYAFMYGNANPLAWWVAKIIVGLYCGALTLIAFLILVAPLEAYNRLTKNCLTKGEHGVSRGIEIDI